MSTEIGNTADREPRPGEIRAVNYRVGVTEDGHPLWKHRLEQYIIGGSGEWAWKPIRVYDEGEDGTLMGAMSDETK